MLGARPQNSRRHHTSDLRSGEEVFEDRQLNARGYAWQRPNGTACTMSRQLSTCIVLQLGSERTSPRSSMVTHAMDTVSQPSRPTSNLGAGEGTRIESIADDAQTPRDGIKHAWWRESGKDTLAAHVRIFTLSISKLQTHRLVDTAYESHMIIEVADRSYIVCWYCIREVPIKRADK